MKYICVKVPSKSMLDFKHQVYEWFRQLDRIGVVFKVQYRGHVALLETETIHCRFIPRHLFDNDPRNYRGMRFDELFWFNTTDERYIGRRDYNTKPYEGTFMDYILEMEGVER